MKKGCAGFSACLLAVLFAVSFAGCSSAPEPLQFTASGPAASGPAAQERYSTVTFKNETGNVLYFLYISERTKPTWGDDRLADDVIMDGGTYTAMLLMGDYDVMAEDFAGDTYTFWIRVDTPAATFTIESFIKD